MSAFYDFLLSIEIPAKYDWVANRVQTEEQKESIQIPNIIRFLIEIVQRQSKVIIEEDVIEGEDHNIMEVDATSFLKNYKSWCASNYFTEDSINSTTFGNLLRDIEGISKRHSHCIQYTINIPSVKKFLIKKRYLVE